MVTCEHCEKKVFCRGLCAGHYQRLRRYGDATFYPKPDRTGSRTRPTTYSTEARECLDCKKVKTAEHFRKRPDGGLMSYCIPCLRERNRLSMKKRYVHKRPPRDPNATCSFEGCGREIHNHKRQLCSGHYQQWWYKGVMTPLQFQGKAEIEGTDEIRKCTNCDAVKPTEEFYVRVTGNPQAQCKVCMSCNNRFNFLMRKGRLDDALAKARATPGRVGKTNEGKALDAIKREEFERSNGTANL